MSGLRGASKFFVGISVLQYFGSLMFHNWVWLYAGLPFIVVGGLLMRRKESTVATVAGKILFVVTGLVLFLSPGSSPCFGTISMMLGLALSGVMDFTPPKDKAKPTAG